MATYDKNDQVRVTATFTTGGTADDPTDNEDDVTITWNKPDGTNTSYTGASGMTRSGTGVYYKDFTLDQIGVHTIRFVGSEGIIAAETVELEVVKSVFDHA